MNIRRYTKNCWSEAGECDVDKIDLVKNQPDFCRTDTGIVSRRGAGSGTYENIRVYGHL